MASESEVRLNKKIERLQAQVNALSSELRKLYRVVTHPSVRTYLHEYSVPKADVGDLNGTANQVIVADGANSVIKKTGVTLSLPQDIHTGATPQFDGLVLTDNVSILGNYYINWRNVGDTVTYAYVMSTPAGLTIAAVNVPFQLQYGALGSSVALSVDTNGNVVWNYDAANADFSISKQTAGTAYYYNAGVDAHTFSGNVGVGATAAWGTNAVDVIGLGIATAPTTSPANVAQLYVVNRNGVDGTASPHIRNEDDTAGYSLGPLYGEMYDYENAVAVAIDETNVYHAVSTIDEVGLYKGWTFKAGSTGPIASFATAEAGAATLITDVAHGLLDGEIITIANSTNYNGAHVITWIDADTFTIPVAYVAEAGGPNWIRGSSLRANAGSAGVYKLTWGATLFPTGANDNFKVEPNLNTTGLDNMAASVRLTVASDRRNMGGSGLVSVADGDYIWFSTRNEDAANDITFRHFNCNVTKV